MRYSQVSSVFCFLTYNLFVFSFCRTWIAHMTPRYLEVKGVELKQSFIMEDHMSYDVYDLALRPII